MSDALHAELVAAVAHASAGFYLDAPQLVAAFDHEVVAMHLSVGLGDDVAEAHGFVDKGDFDEIAAAGNGEAAGARGLLGAALPERGSASGWSGLGLFSLVRGNVVRSKEKAQARKLAPMSSLPPA